MRPSESPESSGPEIDRLLAVYLGQLKDGETVDRERILAEHPDLGDELLRALDAFSELISDGPTEKPLGILGDYTLRRRIGRGGMGVVYEAWQGSMDRVVALKVLPPGVAADSKAFMRFMREAKTAGQLSHRNIVAVYSTGVEEGTPWYSMEYVEGETLARVLGRINESEPEAATPFGRKDNLVYFGKLADAFADVADGLQHAHSKRVIHRDVKPSNLILEHDGRLRILDFGLAHLEGQESLTLSGDVVGTPRYMSPEQARRTKIPVDHRTDVYSLGATMYETLCGRPPFRGKDHADTLSQIIERDPVEPRKVNPRVPKKLETIVLKCLRKDAGDRYGTAEALAQDLRRFVRGDPIEARPPARWEMLARRAWRRKTGLILSLLVLALVAVSLSLLSRYRTESERGARAKTQNAVMRFYLAAEATRGQVDFVWTDPFSFQRENFQAAAADLREASLVIRDPGIHYHRAKSLFLCLQDHEEALRELEAAVSIDPSFTPALVLRSLIHERETRVDPARVDLELAEKSADRPWKSAWLDLHRARCSANWNSAVEACSRLLEEHAGGEAYLGATVEAQMERGLAFIDMGDPAQALEDFSRAETFWPDALQPTVLKCMAYYKLGKPEVADARLKAFFARSANPLEVAVACTGLYYTLADYARSLEWASLPFAGITPAEDARLCLQRAVCLYELGRWAEANEWARRAVGLAPSLLSLRSAAWILQKTLRLAEATEFLKRALAIDPSNAQALWQLAYLFTYAGKNKEAEAPARKSLEVNSRDAVAWAVLSHILCNQRRFEEAVAAGRKAVEIHKTMGMAFAYLGAALVESGDVEEGLEALRENCRLGPSHAPAHNWLGVHLLQVGRLDEAREEFEKAAGLAPGFPWPHWNLGQLHEKELRFASACEEYVKTLEADPSNEDAHTSLAILLRRFGIPEGMEGSKRRLLAVAESAAAAGPEPWRLSTLALARALAGSEADLGAARDAADRAVAATERKDADALAALAAVQRAGGDGGGAVLSLEEALRLESASQATADDLASVRKAVAPRHATYASVDAAFDEEPAALDPNALPSAALRLYAEGRLLEREADRAALVRKLTDASAHEPARPEPALRLAEALRVADEAGEAAASLRQALARAPQDDADLWDLWAAVSLADLGRTPAEVLSDSPHPAEGGHGADLRWLLERLLAREPIRMACGGADWTAPDGTVWGRDRFYRGGRAGGPFDHSDIAGTDDDPLYRTERWFPIRGKAGYRIPLPKGRYRVTLHFAEVYLGSPGSRVFDVRLEGQTVLPSYEPLKAGYATAQAQPLHIPVDDGLLDIEFVARADNPKISAIEVERLP